MNIELRHVTMPTLEVPSERPEIPVEEYEARTRELYDSTGLDWIAIYGDREHNANLLFLSGFDPRFEEAMLLLGPDDKRILMVGNEGLDYASASRLPVDVELYQPFSLMGQPRETSLPLNELLAQSGVQDGQQIGVVGWKYLAQGDVEDASMPSYVPAFLVDTFARVIGSAPVDVTANLMDPIRGLRNQNSAAQIAQYEWGASRASAATFQILSAAKPGMTEYEAVAAMQYAGEPFAAHLMFTTSNSQIVGLLSPSSRRMSKGDGVTTGIAFWGGLCCRAGVITDEVDEAFFADYVRPYYSAIVTWWQTIGLDVTGGEVHDAVMNVLADAPFKPALNPGHLVSFDEWVHSPVRPGSTEQFFSGMAMQCDIIPTPLPDSRGLNCEDTVAIADEALRNKIAAEYPELWARITARREFIANQLGIQLKPEVLPLSVAPAYLPPFWLDHELVCTVA
jgi:hypothetical protein